MNDNTRHPAWWMSWITPGPTIDQRWPWWISGETGNGELIIVAAITAADEDDAWNTIRDAHEPNTAIRTRFAIRKDDPNWTPFAGRFPRAAWMQWDSPNC